MDRLAPHGHRQSFRPQPMAAAVRAGALGHIFLQLLAAGIALGLPVTALHIGGQPLKGLVQHALAPGLIIVQLQLFFARAVENDLLHLRGKLLHRRPQVKVIPLGQGLKVHPADPVGADGVPPAGHHRPIQNGQVLVGDDERRICLELHPQAHTGRTGAKGAVEREHPGRQLLNGDAAVITGVVLGKMQIPLLPEKIHRHQAPGLARRRLHGVCQPPADIRTHDEPVHHDLHRVFFVFIQ